jgi:hypothetical protein
MWLCVADKHSTKVIEGDEICHILSNKHTDIVSFLGDDESL